jgi:hypothetical protein
MALAVAEKQELIKMIEARIDAQVKSIEDAHVAETARLEAKAKTMAIKQLGLGAVYARLRACEMQMEMLKAKVSALVNELLAKVDPESVDSYNARAHLDSAIGGQTCVHAERLRAKTSWGQEIARLRAERDGVKTALLLATTSKEVKGLWTRVSAIIGDDPRPNALTGPALDGDL